MPKLHSLLLKATSLMLALATAIAVSTAVAAQDYPTKPVRILVAFSPGGINDTIARLVAAQLSERLGKQFVVENKPGAGGVIAGEALVNAPKDGHTLLVVSLAIAVNPHIYKMPYDARTAFAPIAILATSTECPVGQCRIAGEFGQGADRAGQGQAGRPALCLLRHGDVHASGAGAVQV